MQNNNLQEMYEFLSRMYDNWYCSPSKGEKAKIEQSVYDFLDKIDDSLYAEMNEGRGRGLCSPQFFKDDILRCISILKDKLQNHH